VLHDWTLDRALFLGRQMGTRLAIVAKVGCQCPLWVTDGFFFGLQPSIYFSHINVDSRPRGGLRPGVLVRERDDLVFVVQHLSELKPVWRLETMVSGLLGSLTSDFG
jgi:hypothetical protein